MNSLRYAREGANNVEYRETDAIYAEELVRRFLSEEPSRVELEDSLVVSDLEADCAEFVAELDLLREVDADVPAARIAGEDLVPVAISLAYGGLWPRLLPTGLSVTPIMWRRHPIFRDWAYYLRRTAEPRLGFETMPREQAKDSFIRRSIDFLATRIAAVRASGGGRGRGWSPVAFLNLPPLAGGSRISTPGCNFTVSTNSPGLRVFWSGAYRISSNYFSHPTTPVTGVLQAGTFVFGVDGGAYGDGIQWDLNAVVRLPGNPYVHLNSRLSG